MSADALLEVENLCTYFALGKSHPFGASRTVYAVDDVSFRVSRGTTFGIVGESGCGKSTTALSVLRLIEATSGAVRFDGHDVLRLKPKPMRRLRSRMQLIFQDPYSSLNPRATAGRIVGAPLKTQGTISSQAINERVAELFAKVGLRPEQRAAFPHQFSGGQRQRISIARALATEPDLIVCDEPVSALDVAIQAQILNLLIRLQRELNLTYLFISHDMGVVQHMCDEVAVMYLGKIVEQADRGSLFSRPLHPYTWSLLSAVPSIYSDAASIEQRVKLQGDPPSPIEPPIGCRFAQRCPFADTSHRCYSNMPKLRKIGARHRVACHRVTEEGVAPQDGQSNLNGR
jgi:peptide/nickel transport system ATP-binding protein